MTPSSVSHACIQNPDAAKNLTLCTWYQFAKGHLWKRYKGTIFPLSIDTKLCHLREESRSEIEVCPFSVKVPMF